MKVIFELNQSDSFGFDIFFKATDGFSPKQIIRKWHSSTCSSPVCRNLNISYSHTIMICISKFYAYQWISRNVRIVRHDDPYQCDSIGQPSLCFGLSVYLHHLCPPARKMCGCVWGGIDPPPPSLRKSGSLRNLLWGRYNPVPTYLLGRGTSKSGDE